MGERGKHLYSFNFKYKPLLKYAHYFRHSLYSYLFISIWFLLLFFFWFSSSTTTRVDTSLLHSGGGGSSTRVQVKVKNKKCDGSLFVYVYNMPAKFNVDLLQDCRHLNMYTDMCPHVANCGLGQAIDINVNGKSSTSSWYATHQFIAEMIFHARVENHPCRTWEPEKATLFYVPFYGGLHASSKFREADLVERDRLALEMVEYLRKQHWWQRKQGRDHFLALGRTAWDFMRTKEGQDFGANCLLNLPEVKNMSVLTVERHPWEGDNQHGIPYPSYLHPSTSLELVRWQDKMRRAERPHLFSFVGAPRTGVQKAAIRDEILRQCSSSQECYLLKCERGASKCHNPSDVLKVMTKSQFCLQAPGDSFTRRSTFDSVLAGCIPVFFSSHTAYTQYAWYLPQDKSEYSVYFPEEDRGAIIVEALRKIPKEKVEKMRSTVISLIPRLTYMHPNATTTHFQFKDAVDIALEQLSKHINSN